MKWQDHKASVIRAYRKGRAKLIQEMGGVCVVRGCKKQDLEFDHYKEPRTWNIRKYNRWVRLARYKRDWNNGLLRLLCRSHNAQFGASKEWKKKRLDINETVWYNNGSR